MKRFLSVVLAIALILACAPVIPLTANAATSGYYTYTVSNGEATITDCKTSISGDITIPATLGGYPVTSIGYEAFRDCSSLASVEIPDSVTSIGDWAFSSCSSLASVEIPDSVTSIGSYAFEDCSSLTSIEIPDSVTSIGNGAFQDCSSLTSIEIPDSVTSISDSAFGGCSSLTSIEIPDSVTSIGNSAFSYCSSLSHVAYTGTQSRWNEISIGSNNSNLTAATRHYEISFEMIDNCVEAGVYCPVCKGFITHTVKEGGVHSYADIHDLSCDTCNYNRTITGISLSKLPEKLGYLLFEELDITGGEVLVTLNDGSTGVISLTEEMVQGFDSATIGAQVLTVSYNGFTTTFTVEVIAQMPDSVELLTKPDKLSYMIGDTLDLTGLTLKALYGTRAAVVTAANVTAQANMTVAGIQTVTVTYGKSTTFEIYVHEGGTVTVDSSLYPESAHNYGNNINQTKTLTVPGATQLVLTFNSNSQTESNYDYVYILDGKGNQVGKYSGSLANKVVTVPGDTVQIKLTSDGSNTAYGYKFSSITADMGVGMFHPETIVPGYAPTCTEPGLTDGSICAICGEVVTQQVEIPATGHDTIDGVCQNCDYGKNVVILEGDGETFYSTVENALAAATGGTIKLLTDMQAGTLVLPSGVELDLNGYTLTARYLVVAKGAEILDSGALKIAKDNLIYAQEDGNGIIPVWNGTDGYVFTKVTFQQMAKTEEEGTAQYIFLPNFSNAEAAALLADGGADNDLKMKVGLTWNNGQCQQFYTYGDDLVEQVFASGGRLVFSLTVTGISGITDMTAQAVVVTDSGAQATNVSIPVVAG